VTFITDKNGAGFWIGANDKDIEDDWVWESNKSKLLFSDWLVGVCSMKHLFFTDIELALITPFIIPFVE
jgi:hypothetical protein